MQAQDQESYDPEEEEDDDEEEEEEGGAEPSVDGGLEFDKGDEVIAQIRKQELKAKITMMKQAIAQFIQPPEETEDDTGAMGIEDLSEREGDESAFEEKRIMNRQARERLDQKRAALKEEEQQR